MFIVGIYFCFILIVLLMIYLLLEKIFRILRKIQKRNNPPPVQPPSVSVNILLDGKKGIPMNLQDNKPVTAALELVDAAGNVAPGAQLDASPAPSWQMDDASFGSLVPAADGLSAVLTPAGKLGTCHIQFAGSLNGAPVQAVSEDIVIVPGQAVSIKMVLQ
jgi:hypothetical protein